VVAPVLIFGALVAVFSFALKTGDPSKLPSALIGKPVGIFCATWAAVRAGLAPQPQGARWVQVLGVGMLGGIGFTMSLFIGMLAFSDSTHATQLRLGVLFGSLLSAMAGYAVLRLSAPVPRESPE
jgi:NhaA family Na+:H+ antiporter